MNPYDTLNVGNNADDKTIKAAYRKLAQVHHPDRAGGNAEFFREVQLAYEILSSLERRKQYDETGDSAERPTTETEAKSFVLQAMAAVLDTPSGDIVTNATVMLQGKFAEHRRNMSKVDEIEKRLRVTREKITVKEGERNLAHMVIDQRLEPLPRVRAEGARITAAYELAFEMLRKHDVQSEPIMENSGAYFRAATMS